MGDVKIKWKGGNFYRAAYPIRSDPALVDLEEKIADAIALAANTASGLEDGFIAGSRQGASRPQGRWRTSVVTATWEAMYYNAKTNILLRLLTGEQRGGFVSKGKG